MSPLTRRWGALCVVGLLAALFCNAPRIERSWRHGRTSTVAFEAQSDSGCRVHVLHDFGKGFVDSGVQGFTLPADGAFHPFEFPLPDARVVGLGLGVEVASGHVPPVLKVRNAVLVPKTAGGDIRDALSPISQDMAIADPSSSVRALITLPVPEPVVPAALGGEAWFGLIREFGPAVLLHSVLLTALLGLLLRFSATRDFLQSHVLRVSCVLVICGLATVVAVITPFGVHPDEGFHVLTASYYADHWFPPAALDPTVARYVDGYFGVTYLLTTPPEVVYLLAAKAIALLGPVGSAELVFRAFNVVLLIVLAVVLATRPSLDPMHVLALVVTPQLWYVFSYFNGDALPLAVSFILAWQLGDDRSPVRRYLSSGHLREHLGGGVFLGILLALLVLGKANYLSFLAFVLIVAGWRQIVLPTDARRTELKRWVTAGGIAALCVAPFVLVDFMRNGWHRADLLVYLCELYGRPGFRPSDATDARATTGMWMAARGIPLTSLFTDFHWHVLSFRSFLGMYGYLSVALPPYHYLVHGTLIGATLVGFGIWIRRGVDRRGATLIAGALCCVALLVAASLYRSWTYAPQPQGRYFLPAIPMLLLTWRLLVTRARLEPPRKSITMLIPIFLIVGGYSFVCGAVEGLSR